MDVVTMIQEGMTAQEVAAKTGRSISGVYHIAKQAGLYFNRRQRYTERDSQIIAYRRQGMGYRQIAGLLGMDASNVRKACKTLGVDGSWYAEAPKKRTTEELQDLCKMRGFLYVGGYVNNTSHIQIECDKCGCVRTIAYGSLLQNGAVCHNCMAVEAKVKSERNELLKALSKEEAKCERFTTGDCKQ